MNKTSIARITKSALLTVAVTVGLTSIAAADTGKKAMGQRGHAADTNHTGTKAKGERWRAADTNHNGKLDPAEKLALVRARTQKIFADLDLNGDNQIGPFERAKASARLQKMLTSADTDNNRFVTRIELRAQLAKRHADKWKGKNSNQWKGKNSNQWKGKKGNRSDKPGKQGPKAGKPHPPVGWQPAAPVPSRPVVAAPIIRDHRAIKPPVPAKPGNQRVSAIHGGKIR